MILTISVSSNPDAFKTKTQEGFGLIIYNEFGHIGVLTGGKYSPAKHSITTFEVKETARRKGVGDKLLKEAISRFGEDLGGQASSLDSLRLMFKNGFWVAADKGASLADATKMLREDSSVYMRYSNRKSSTSTTTDDAGVIRGILNVKQFAKSMGFKVKLFRNSSFSVFKNGKHAGNFMREGSTWAFYPTTDSSDDAKALLSDLPKDFNM